MQAVQEVVRPSLERTLSQSLGAELMECDQGPIELSPARHREIMSSVYKSLENVRTSRVPGDSNLSAWKVKLHKRNVAYYIDKTSVLHGQTRCCAVGYTHATVDELVGLFLPAEKRAMLQNTGILFDNVVDVDVVSTLRSPTKERPMSSVYVRRVNCQTSGPWSSRETYAIVATDVIPQSDGSTVGYCLWESIDNQDIAQAVRTTSFRHPTSFRSGFYFRQPGTTESASGDSTQGQTEIVYMVGIESGVWATSRFALEKHGSSVRRLCSHVRHKHLNPSTFVTKMQWESKCSAKSCGQCDKRFHMLSNRVNCHACGHVVCRSCTSKEPMALHVCFGCLKKAGLPAPASAEKMQLCERQRHVHSSSTTKTFEQSSIAVVYADVNDHDGVDTGEWAISTVGIPIQLSRKNAVCV
uniref:FYVE-type domain-containing protein n=1 Tax=Peronospora matthiolae TaxID=2874970 RepID=A0AAV1TIT7_9STRA